MEKRSSALGNRFHFGQPLLPSDLMIDLAASLPHAGCSLKILAFSHLFNHNPSNELSPQRIHLGFEGAHLLATQRQRPEALLLESGAIRGSVSFVASLQHQGVLPLHWPYSLGCVRCKTRQIEIVSPRLAYCAVDFSIRSLSRACSCCTVAEPACLQIQARTKPTPKQRQRPHHLSLQNNSITTECSTSRTSNIGALLHQRSSLWRRTNKELMRCNSPQTL